MNITIYTSSIVTGINNGDYDGHIIQVETSENLSTSITYENITFRIVRGGTLNITESLEIGCDIEVQSGGKVNISNSKTLTVNTNISADIYHVFDGLGNLGGKPKIKYLYPQWFGAKSSDSSFNSTDSLQKTINTSIVLGVPVKLTVGVYYVDELYIDNNTKPFKIVGDLIDRAGQLEGSTIELRSTSLSNIIFHLGHDGTSKKRSVGIHIENVNFRTIKSRSNETYAIKGGDYSNLDYWVQRVTIEKCTFSNFVYGIYLGGYSDGLTLSNLKFETINRCIYVAKADGSRISNIVAEPYIEYVLHSIHSMGLVLSDAILRGAKTELNTELTVPFIIQGVDAGIVNHDSPVEIKNCHIETSNGICIIANAPRTTFQNFYFQLVEGLTQNHHTIVLLNNGIQPVQNRFINFTIQREKPIKSGKKDIFVNTYSSGQTYDLIETSPTNFGFCRPEDLLIENWNIDPTSDVMDRKGDGRFEFTINGKTERDFIIEDGSNYLDVTTSRNGIREMSGTIKVTATGSSQLIKILKTSTPWEGILKILMYKANNSNACRSRTYRVSGAYSSNKFLSDPLGAENFTTLTGTPTFIGPKTGSELFNTSIDFEFQGDNGQEYVLIFHYEGISQLP